MELKKEKLKSDNKLHIELVLGEPIQPARVGHEFQAEIPSLRAEYNGSPGMELPIPVIWTHKYIQNHVRVHELDVDSQAVEELETERSQLDAERIPVSGTISKDWTPDELDHILLGLYIFGKDFVLIEKFLQNVKIGDLLSFYYGKFYRADKYGRWSKTCDSKNKCRKIISGRKMFKGWRHQELLSRLFQHISADRRKMVVEIAWLYDLGEYPFEDYALTLSNIVGIDKLNEAVAIGTGKRDLTGSTMKPPDGNKTFSYHPGNPSGKAFSSLSSVEILGLLRGRYRLSKTQGNDLFWDAVWPRLRARGWHSKNQSLPGGKKNIVFLLPGIKSFSRRAHVKGSHYLDSIEDVLQKIALDPKILDQELEIAAESCEKSQEHGMEPKLGQQVLHVFSIKKCGHYLQPQNVNNNMHDKISAAADASLIHQEQPEMRESLPCEVRSEHSCFNDSGESSNNANIKAKVYTTYVRRSNGKSIKLDSRNGLREHRSKCTGGKCSIEDDQTDLSGKVCNCLDAVKESLDLNACVIEVSSDSSVILLEETKLHNYESDWRSSSCDGCEDMDYEDAISQAVSSSDRSSGATITNRSIDVDMYVEKNKLQRRFDLNFPHAQSDVKAKELLSKYPVQNDGNQHVNESLFSFDAGKQPEPWNITDETCQGGDSNVGREKPSTFLDLNLPVALEDAVQNNDEQHGVNNEEQHVHASRATKQTREQLRKDVLQNNDKQHVVDPFPLSKSNKQPKKIFWEDVVPKNNKQKVVEAVLPSNPTESEPVDNTNGGGSNIRQLSATDQKRQRVRVRPLSLRASAALDCVPRKKRKGIVKSQDKPKKCHWQTDGSKVGSSSLNEGSVKQKSTTSRLEMDRSVICVAPSIGVGKRWADSKAVAGER